MDPRDITLAQLASLGATKVASSLSVTLYVRSTLYPERDGIIAAIDDYLSRSEPHLRWYADMQVTRYRRTTPEMLRLPVARLRDDALAGKDFWWRAHGGATGRAPSPYVIAGSSWNEPDRLNYLRATFPIEQFAASFDAFAELVGRWARSFHVHHGYAGFALNESPVREEQQSNSKLVYAVARRFRGLEVDDPELTARSAVDAIKGANWLTLIGDAFVEQLGGADALRARLGPTIGVSPVLGGLMLQAGPAPRLGDVNAEEPMTEYEEVARALRPIRMKKHFPLGPAEFGSFGWEGTNEWLRRFEG